MRGFSGSIGAALLIVGAACPAPALAQVALGVPTPTAATNATALANAPTPDWTFEIAPYFWASNVSGKLNASLPGGRTVNEDIFVGFGKLLPDLRFATMFSAQVSHQDFSAFTDFYYVNLGMNGTANRLTSVSGPLGHVTVPVGLQLQTGTGLGLTAWTLGAGYRLAHGDWGEIEGIAGARLLDVTSSTHYTLSADVMGPGGGGVVLARNGSLSAGGSFWDGIVGVKGRFNLANSGFFVPYYLDIGTGAMPLTWQAYAGVGYSWKWVDVSAGWRVLDYQKSSSSSVENISLNGLIAAANFRF